jgi:hypothetical protein
MNSPECDLKGHGPCSDQICRLGMTLNYRCEAHVRLQSYWAKRNPGKKLNDWLEGLRDGEREDAIRNAPPIGTQWQTVHE